MRAIAVGLCRRPTDGALLVEHGHDRHTGARFFRAIGGGIEPGETPAAAVGREWREEFALAVTLGRALGTLETRFVYEGQPGAELVHVFEVHVQDPGVYARAELVGTDPTGQRHTAVWVLPTAWGAGAPPLYPAGVLSLFTAG